MSLGTISSESLSRTAAHLPRLLRPSCSGALTAEILGAGAAPGPGRSHQLPKRAAPYTSPSWTSSMSSSPAPSS